MFYAISAIGLEHFSAPVYELNTFQHTNVTLCPIKSVKLQNAALDAIKCDFLTLLIQCGAFFDIWEIIHDSLVSI